MLDFAWLSGDRGGKMENDVEKAPDAQKVVSLLSLSVTMPHLWIPLFG
jgi:hypothetical protein